jgi:DNA modification methylase|tara:strand:- start:554 stop:1786 length:1233 start_codon:yes stop_codon:yes gene_type:complete
MDIVERPISELVPYAANSRTHSDEQVAQIAASIKEFGFTNPILTDGDKGIIAGHGRLMAARKLKLETVPTIELSYLTPTQRKAYIIADNKLALNAGWDMDLLSIEMTGLQDEGFDLSLIGFGDDELAAILADKTEGLTDPDDVPELPDDPVTKPGDVWILGKHRLMCGDSTVATDVETLLNGVSPHLMVTDPPYGVEYDANWRNKAERADGTKIGASAIGVVSNDDNADWSEAWALFPGDVAYVWHAGNKAHTVADSLETNGLNIRAQIIWAKNQFVIGRGDYHPQHEPCWYAVRKGKTGHYDGGRKQSTIWNIDKPRKSETGHSTQKPVECMKRPIENNSSPGQAVYEPFSGSGTTIIAGEMTARSIYAMELSPAYVDVAVKRWQDFTGEQAKLEGSGEIFPTIKENAA